MTRIRDPVLGHEAESTPSMHNRQSLLDYLEANNILTQTIEHPPVFTVDEAQKHTGHLPGAHVKNLFLIDKSGVPWLVTCRDQQTVKVNGLARLLKAPRFTFGKPEALRSLLGVEPGSVTPLSLINDEARAVKFVIDQNLLTFELMNVHPLENTATTAIRPVDLISFAKGLGYEPIIVNLDDSHNA